MTLSRNIIFFICALVIITAATYWPGTSGGFILDDHASLSTLSKNDGITDLNSAMQYALSGKESFIGRPLSRLSFTLNASTWPTDPYPFKITNIFIHTLNALLLFALFYIILKAMNRPAQQAAAIAFTAALFWAIHPAQTSTVLYIVQRMAELSTLFIIAGLLCYVRGRTLLFKNPGAGYTLMSIGVIVFGLLAFLNKETGILITVLILIIEFTLLNKPDRPRYWRYWAIPILGLPVLIIAGYFIMIIANHESHYIARNFGLYERLLTQPRVLMDYLVNFAFPFSTPAIQHDHFSLSSGIATPFTTLISILTVIVALVLAVRVRFKQPLLSFAILWFFGAHLLESTVLPLEIYFEHRNYIPLIGPSLAAAYYLYEFLKTKRRAFPIVVIVIATTLFAFSWRYSSTWGNEASLAQTWVDEAPQSVRRQVFLLNHHLQSADIENAHQVASTNYKNHPDKLGAQSFYVATACLNNRLEKQDYQNLIASVKTKKIDSETFPAMSRLYEFIQRGYCKQISWQGMEIVLDSLLANPNIEHWSWIEVNAYKMKAEINRNLRRFSNTVAAYNKALELEPTINVALKLAHLYISTGGFAQAQNYIIHAKIIDDMRRPWTPSQSKLIDDAEQSLSEAIAQRNSGRVNQQINR